MVALQTITDASSTLQSVLTTTIPYENFVDYPTNKTPESEGWNNDEYQTYRNWIVDNAYDITVSYDGSADLTSLIGDTELSIIIRVRDLNLISGNNYKTTINVVQPDPPTFAGPLPAQLIMIVGKDQEWPMPSIIDGDFAFVEPIALSSELGDSLTISVDGSSHALVFTSPDEKSQGTATIILSSTKSGVSKTYTMPYEVIKLEFDDAIDPITVVVGYDMEYIYPGIITSGYEELS